VVSGSVLNGLRMRRLALSLGVSAYLRLLLSRAISAITNDPMINRVPYVTYCITSPPLSEVTEPPSGFPNLII
jgi:hypothetical protein